MLGGFAFVLFAIVFFRLWFLQVLSGDDYVSQARENRVRKIKIEAPRGDIVDRNGNLLVTHAHRAGRADHPQPAAGVRAEVADDYRTALSARRARAPRRGRQAARVRPAPQAEGPQADARERRERRALDRRRAEGAAGRDPADAGGHQARAAVPAPGPRAADVAAQTIHRRVVEGVAEASVPQHHGQDRRAARAVQLPARAPGALPGRRGREAVPAQLPAQGRSRRSCSARSARSTPDQLKHQAATAASRRARASARAGSSSSTTATCAARDGYTRVVVNALGSRDDTRAGHAPRARSRASSCGSRSTSASRRPADNAIKRGDRGRQRQRQPGAGAAPTWRWTRATARSTRSAPTRASTPTIFAKPISQEHYDELTSEANGAPLFNRAIAGAYPTGSIFKPITAIASLAGRARHADADDHRRRQVQARPADVPERARRQLRARCNMARRSRSPRTSSSTRWAAAANARGPIIQHVGARLGLGHRTGIDLPGEFGGLVPDRQWRDAGYAQVPEVRRARARAGRDERRAVQVRRHRARRGRRATTSTSRSARATCRPPRCRWPSPTRRSPTAGTSSRPHLGAAIEDGAGRPSQEIRKPARRAREDRPSATCDTILEGLHAAHDRPGRHLRRTSSRASPRPRSTARPARPSAPGQADQSWYAVLRAATRPRPIVVVVTVEKGGFGAETAAPAARLILSNWFDLGNHKFKRRDLADAMSADAAAHPAGLRARRPRSSRASSACGSTRCCCWRRSGSSPAR